MLVPLEDREKFRNKYIHGARISVAEFGDPSLHSRRSSRCGHYLHLWLLKHLPTKRELLSRAHLLTNTCTCGWERVRVKERRSDGNILNPNA